MNERIRELIEQAGFEEKDGHISIQGVYMFNTTRMEKFAELIVKEMCDMMRQCQDDCDTGDASETNWGYISQLQDWIDAFERHFGVDE